MNMVKYIDRSLFLCVVNVAVHMWMGCIYTSHTSCMGYWTLIMRKNLNEMTSSLTGSAKMTTWTVALPGVSRLTSGVSTEWPALLTRLSRSANCVRTMEEFFTCRVDTVCNVT